MLLMFLLEVNRPNNQFYNSQNNKTDKEENIIDYYI